MDKYGNINNLKESIRFQITHNKGRNFFVDHSFDTLTFTDDTIKKIQEYKDLGEEVRNELIEFALDSAIKEFCRINQFFNIEGEAKTQLRHVYKILLERIIRKEFELEELQKQHYANLKNWFLNHFPYVEQLYCNKAEYIEPLVCAEYTPELQLKIFNIDISQLMEPVLDIGAGENANLVKYLRAHGIESYGIERFATKSHFVETLDWLKYKFIPDYWGTIISHLAFSNHFIYAYQLKVEDWKQYSIQYASILKSLKPKGCFYYSPELPFIEEHLNKSLFNITKTPIANTVSHAVCILRQ